MKIVRYATLIIDWLLAVALAVAALLYIAGTIFGSQFIEEVQAGIWQFRTWALVVISLVALVTLALNFLLAAESVRWLFWPRYLKLQAGEDRVNVSIKAVEDALRRALLGLDEVSGARVSVIPPARDGRPVVLRAYVTLRESVVYHSISRGIIDVLESRFNDIVSAGTPVECRVYWEKIKHDRSRPAAAQRTPTESMRPQFPVEEEGQ